MRVKFVGPKNGSRNRGLAAYAVCGQNFGRRKKRGRRGKGKSKSASASATALHLAAPAFPIFSSFLSDFSKPLLPLFLNKLISFVVLNIKHVPFEDPPQRDLKIPFKTWPLGKCVIRTSCMKMKIFVRSIATTKMLLVHFL